MRMRKTRIFRPAIAATLLCLTAYPGHAQTAVPATLGDAQKALQAADASLNAIWKRCTEPASTTVQSIAAMRSAQLLWPRFRDMNARAYQLGQSSRRPLDDVYYVHAQTLMTLDRATELKLLFGCN